MRCCHWTTKSHANHKKPILVLQTGDMGFLKIAKTIGCGTSVVQRVVSEA
jgi:hypothetical protein